MSWNFPAHWAWRAPSLSGIGVPTDRCTWLYGLLCKNQECFKVMKGNGPELTSWLVKEETFPLTRGMKIWRKTSWEDHKELWDECYYWIRHKHCLVNVGKQKTTAHLCPKEETIRQMELNLVSGSQRLSLWTECWIGKCRIDAIRRLV